MSQYDSSWIDRMRAAYHDSPFMRSGFVTVLVVAALLAAVFGLWYEHIQGNFHRVRVVQYVADKPAYTLLGGLAIENLARSPNAESMSPEFVSASLAPGLGMQTLQATIHIPGHGDMPLLWSSDTGSGKPTDATVVAPIVVEVAERNGTRWADAVDVLRHRAADRASSNTMPDGSSADAFFNAAATFNTAATNRPAAKDLGVETSVSANLGGRALDFVVIAKNVSSEPRAVTMSWQPRFLLGGGMTMVLPRLESKEGATTPPPVRLGERDVHAVYTRMKRSYLSNGPAVELQDVADGYQLSLTAISPSVRSLRVDAAKDGKAVLLEFGTGTGEPGDAGKTVLKPGESEQLRLRLEVTAVSTYSR